jgi:hypothetical protein
LSSTKTLIALTLCAWLVPSVVQASAQKTVDGWRIKQQCLMQGEEQIVACSLGVKIWNPKNDLTILYTAPFKDVIYYDKHTGLMCKVIASKNDNPYQRTIGMFSGMSLADIPLHKVSSSKLVNMPTDNYEADASYSEEQVKRSRVEGRTSNLIKTVNYSVFSTLQLALNENEFVAKHYGLPHKKIPGVPAYLLYKGLTNKSTLYLSTQSCERSKVSDSEFVVPPNLKPAKSSQEVLSGNNPGIMLF